MFSQQQCPGQSYNIDSLKNIKNLFERDGLYFESIVKGEISGLLCPLIRFYRAQKVSLSSKNLR